MKLFAPFLIAFLLAWPAQAQDWLKFGSSTKTTTGLSTGQWASYDATDDSNSLRLNVSACENIDILFWPDVGASGGTTTITANSCATTTVSTNSCWIMENATLTGNPATNLEAIYGAGTVQLFIDSVVFGSGDEPRVIVRCNGPKN